MEVRPAEFTTVGQASKAIKGINYKRNRKRKERQQQSTDVTHIIRDTATDPLRLLSRDWRVSIIIVAYIESSN